MANVAAFKYLLRNANFTVYCDHSALVHIMAAKREPPTLRLKKLMEHLSDYKFNIKFLKGKEMHISDFLSRHPDNDNDSPNEIIPIAFLVQDVCNVVTRSMSKKAEAEVLSMYPLNPFNIFGSAALPIITHLNYLWECCAPITTTVVTITWYFSMGSTLHR